MLAEPNNSHYERARTLLRQSIDLLGEAAIEINSFEITDKREAIRGEIGMAVAHISGAGTKLPGGLSLGVKSETPVPDGPLSEEEQNRVDRLNDDDLRSIDEALLSHCSSVHFRKVARVVGSAMMDREDRFEGIPDIFYSQRVTKLVESGRLEHQGRLGYMRFCEVRLPQRTPP